MFYNNKKKNSWKYIKWKICKFSTLKRQNMEKEMASRSSILAWEIPQRSLVVKGHKKSQTRLTKQQRETETGSRRGPRAMYAGTPHHRRQPPPGSALTSCSLMAEGPQRATGGDLLLSSEAYLASHQWGGPQEVILDLPHPQCLPRTTCWFPIVAVNHSSGKKIKGKTFLGEFQEDSDKWELYYVHGLECC